MQHTKIGGSTAWQVKRWVTEVHEYMRPFNCTSPAAIRGLGREGEGKSGASWSHWVGPWSKVFPKPHLWYEELLLLCDGEPGSPLGSRWKAGQPRTARRPESQPLVFTTIYILPCCPEALDSGSQLLFPLLFLSCCIPTFPPLAKGSCHSASFHPFYTGNQRKDQRRLLRGSSKHLMRKGSNQRGGSKEAR